MQQCTNAMATITVKVTTTPTVIFDGIDTSFSSHQKIQKLFSNVKNKEKMIICCLKIGIELCDPWYGTTSCFPEFMKTLPQL